MKIVQSSLILLSMLCVKQYHAQESTISAGSTYTGSGGSVAFSSGQIVYTTYNSAFGSVAQGIQQPYEIFITTGILEKGIQLVFSAFPSPTNDLLFLKVSNITDQLFYQICDINGKFIKGEKITENTTSISMNEFAKAIYFLKVLQNYDQLKVFKILKN